MALLEVLLSGFIIVTGILAILTMQTMALSSVQTSRHFLQAEWLLNDILERMKANPAGFAVSLAGMPQGEFNAACESRNGCSSVELAAHDLAQWHMQLEAKLPAGRGELVPTIMAGYPGAVQLYSVRVRWHGNQGDNQAASMPVSSSIVALR